MSRKIKVQTGGATVEIEGAQQSVFTEILKKAAPQTFRILQDTVQDIYNDAYRVWPVRQAKNVKDLTEEGKVRVTANNISKVSSDDYTRKRAFAAAYNMQRLGTLKTPEVQITSKGSKEKLYTELVFTSEDIFAKVGNSAPYAWAIKVGEKTDLPYAMGANVSNELLWKPAKQKANKIVRVIANELMQDAKKAK